MARGRKDQFEDQLRDLQKDISNLSQKLSIPTLVTSHRYATNDESHSVGMETSQDLNRSYNNGSARSHAPTDKGDKYAQLMQDAHVAKKERDDAMYRLEQAKLEIEDMRKSLQDMVRLKTAYEHLKQDYESVKVSLESSERIRKQQKELINLLQRSHSIAVASDSGSIMSLNSISSIEHASTQPSSSSRKPMDLSSASLAAENREWLYKSMELPGNVSSRPQTVPPTSSESSGVQKTRRKSRSGADAYGLPPRPSMSTNPGYPTSSTSAQLNDASEQRRASISANNSTNNSTATGNSSTKGSTRRPSKTTSGSKTRRKSTKNRAPETIPTHLLGNFAEGVPSYQNIIGMNTSLLPNARTDVLNKHSFAGTGYAGTDVGTYTVPFRNPVDLSTSHVSLQSHHSRYSQVGDFSTSMSSPGLSTLPPNAGYQSAGGAAAAGGRPPRHPAGGVPASAPSGAPSSRTRHITATIPSVHTAPAAAPHSYAHPSGYIPPAGYSLVPDPPAGATPHRPATAGNVGTGARSGAGRSAKTSPGFSRRIPNTPSSTSGATGSTPRSSGKVRSTSAPPVRHVSPAPRPTGVSTFGNASRNL